jgi:hypothetical protein
MGLVFMPNLQKDLKEPLQIQRDARMQWPFTGYGSLTFGFDKHKHLEMIRAIVRLNSDESIPKTSRSVFVTTGSTAV